MRPARRDVFYTIDEVVESSGYQKNTIYNLTCDKIISAPIKGLLEASYCSQGLYKETVFEELALYRSLKLSGMKKREIIEYLNRVKGATNEPVLPLLET